MSIWTTILSIILFIIALSALVAIHEFGHFIAAKKFNVYCSTFSIGFGPKFFKHKRKNGETTFTLGVVPFGGYVEMYGEGVELPDGVTISKDRSLEGISRWKKIIIFLAGITMNFILAFIIFFISASCFPQISSDFTVNICEVTNSSKFNETFTDLDGNTLVMDEKFVTLAATVKYDYTLTDSNGESKTYSVNGLSLIISSPSDKTNDIYALGYGSDWGSKKLDYSYMMSVYSAKSRFDSSISNFQVLDSSGEYVNIESSPISYLKDYDFSLPIVNESKELVKYSISNNKLQTHMIFRNINDKSTKEVIANFNVENGKIVETGMSAYARFEYLGWKSFETAGKKWVKANTQITDALFNLIKGDKTTWNSVGGPVAIFSQTTQILSNYNFNYYLDTWGIISVNLALFNLLPFPGLDGWQVLVELIEGFVNIFYKNGKKIKKNKEKDNSNEITSNKEVINECVAKTNNTTEIDKDTIVVGKDDDKISKNNSDEWKIPSKVKNIISGIGLVILFAFMALVFLKDIFFK